MLQEGIEWRFNPPAAPHFGGVWERLVRPCKRAIQAIVRRQILTDEVLLTVMAEVEALLNGRPLTHVSTHLPSLRTTFSLAELARTCRLTFSWTEVSSRRRWRQVQAVTNQVWRRWLGEYVPNLLERRKWTFQVRNLKQGVLVLVVDTDSPRRVWPLGRVIRAITGDSGVVRAVEVKTKRGIFVPPVAKIVLLEENEELVKKLFNLRMMTCPPPNSVPNIGPAMFRPHDNLFMFLCVLYFYCISVSCLSTPYS